MTKRISAKYKISRRFGLNLWGRAKDPLARKNYAPGQHGSTGKKKPATDFGLQLRAKQILKGYYGNITEKQFSNIFKFALNKKGDTGENLVGLLESRLDAVVYRAKFAPTVFAARQLVSHRHILVNGKVVNIPSARVKEGDTIEVKEGTRTNVIVIEATESGERDVPEYITAENAFKVTFTRKPRFDEVPYPVEMQPQLVVEYYSR
jgi:small subunit ribosomal protein S4